MYAAQIPAHTLQKHRKMEEKRQTEQEKTAPPEKVRRTCGAHAQIAKKCAGCPLTAPIMI